MKKKRHIEKHKPQKLEINIPIHTFRISTDFAWKEKCEANRRMTKKKNLFWLICNKTEGRDFVSANLKLKEWWKKNRKKVTKKNNGSRILEIWNCLHFHVRIWITQWDSRERSKRLSVGNLNSLTGKTVERQTEKKCYWWWEQQNQSFILRFLLLVSTTTTAFSRLNSNFDHYRCYVYMEASKKFAKRRERRRIYRTKRKRMEPKTIVHHRRTEEIHFSAVCCFHCQPRKYCCGPKIKL